MVTDITYTTLFEKPAHQLVNVRLKYVIHQPIKIPQPYFKYVYFC